MTRKPVLISIFVVMVFAIAAVFDFLTDWAPSPMPLVSNDQDSDSLLWSENTSSEGNELASSEVPSSSQPSIELSWNDFSEETDPEDPPVNEDPADPDGILELTVSVSEPTDAENAKTMSRDALINAYETGSSAQRSLVINELKRRAQRATEINTEYHDNMLVGTTYNVRVIITRGIQGQLEVNASESAVTFMTDTIEPTAERVIDTETTMEVGVKLSGAGITADPKNLVWTLIPDGGEKTLSWLVTPIEEGNVQMLVEVVNKVDIGSQSIELEARNFPQPVTVSTDIWTKIGRFFSGVDTAVNTAQSIGMAIAALLGFGGIGALYAGIRKIFGRRTTEPTS